MKKVTPIWKQFTVTAREMLTAIARTGGLSLSLESKRVFQNLLCFVLVDNSSRETKFTVLSIYSHQNVYHLLHVFVVFFNGSRSI